MSAKNIIVLDLGATKCAAALVCVDDHYTCKNKYSIKLTECQSLEELLFKIEQALGCRLKDADAICIGAAGQYDGEQLQLAAGYPYPMNFAQLAHQQKWPIFAVIHDYAPVVCATFTSYMTQTDNIKRLNQCSMNPLGRRIAMGVGTGLGLKDGVLFEDGNFWLGTNEMGHIGITHPPCSNDDQRKQHHELLKFLAPQQNITFEKILSGGGISRLYQFFYPTTTDLTPEEIGNKMKNGLAEEVYRAFAWYLGLFVGTVQLAVMPDGGIWITGGVVQNHPEVFDRKEFFQGIEASPAYLVQRQQFPLGVLCNPEHAFMGGAYYAMRRLLNLLT